MIMPDLSRWTERGGSSHHTVQRLKHRHNLSVQSGRLIVDKHQPKCSFPVYVERITLTAEEKAESKAKEDKAGCNTESKTAAYL